MPGPDLIRRCRLLPRLLFVFVLAAVGWSAIAAPAQEPPKQPAPRAENGTSRRTSDAELNASELLERSKREANPYLKDLFYRMGVPHDVVTLADGRRLKVDPIPDPSYEKPFSLKVYDDQWNLIDRKSTAVWASWKARLRPEAKSSVVEVRTPYEELAVGAVNQFLQSPGPEKALSAADRLGAAETVLESALRFHSNRGRDDATKRRPSAAGAVLEQRLREILRDWLHELAETGDWKKAFVCVRRIAHLGPDPSLRDRVAEEIIPLLVRSMDRSVDGEAKRCLGELKGLPGFDGVTEGVTERLRQEAGRLLEEARAAKIANKLERAHRLAAEADRRWPLLPGLRELRRELDGVYPSLYVGVVDLPVFFSPATARLDSEKRAVELLFQGLIKLYDGPGGQTFEPDLAVNLPRLASGGREFLLDPGARWSTGEPVTAADVRSTVELLRKPGWTGFAPEWANLVEAAGAGRDASVVTLGLRQGFLDPLSLLTFKVLPSAARLNSPDNRGFARQPVGSGPYQLARGPQAPDRDGEVVFTANPHYQRAGGQSAPFFKEIRFFRADQPAELFKAGKLHLLLDVPPQQVGELRKDSESPEGIPRLQTLRNRRVYFLAVNHRRQALQNQALRKAIAHAINRAEILQEFFPGPATAGSDPPHRPLNGPYPPDSWAANPDYPPDPFRKPLAAEMAAKVRAALPGIRLTLKYPEGDDAVRQACQKIKDQVADAAGVPIELVPRPRRDLYADVEVNHDYELAYYSYDYPSELYWLWPLFNPDPRAVNDPGGRNFLGYQNDGELLTDLLGVAAHRDFSKVRTHAHNVHKQVWEKMPLIPLWQLDTVIAFHKDLEPVRIDPLLIFNDVGHWKRKKS
jgi:ABC-type transport system substrate-binding protein